jgi:hypothetical protein
MAERVFEDGAVVCRAGDPAMMVFRIRAGALTVEPVGGPLDRPYVMLPGEMFGAEALLAGALYDATARARGRTVLEIADRAAVLAALAARPETALPLIRAALAQGNAPEAPAEPAAALTAEIVPLAPGRAHRPADGAPTAWAAPTPFGAPRLMPATPALVEQIGANGVPVLSFPFVIGREETRGGGHGAHTVDLALQDHMPYNLSRRHFAIERDGDRLLVRDCGSYLGTIVNGTEIGGSRRHHSATLQPGENAITAGKPSSPIRFSLTIA